MTKLQLFELQARNRGTGGHEQKFAVHGLLIDGLDRQHAEAIYNSLSSIEREQWPSKANPVNVAEAEGWFRAWRQSPAQAAAGDQSDGERLATTAEIYARRAAIFQNSGTAPPDRLWTAEEHYAFVNGIYNGAGRR